MLTVLIPCGMGGLHVGIIEIAGESTEIMLPKQIASQLNI